MAALARPQQTFEERFRKFRENIFSLFDDIARSDAKHLQEFSRDERFAFIFTLSQRLGLGNYAINLVRDFTSAVCRHLTAEAIKARPPDPAAVAAKKQELRQLIASRRIKRHQRVQLLKKQQTQDRAAVMNTQQQLVDAFAAYIGSLEKLRTTDLELYALEQLNEEDKKEDDAEAAARMQQKLIESYERDQKRIADQAAQDLNRLRNRYKDLGIALAGDMKLQKPCALAAPRHDETPDEVLEEETPGADSNTAGAPPRIDLADGRSFQAVPLASASSFSSSALAARPDK